MTPKRRLMVGRLPGSGWEHTDCVDWLLKTAAWAAVQPDLEVLFAKRVDTPTDMVRNALCQTAREQRCDWLLMVDDDMAPDLDPAAPPFLPAAVAHLRAHAGPCLVAAPYCSGPPDEKVLVYRWADQRAGVSARESLREYPRDEAAAKTGVERVAALATGLLLIDLRVLDVVPPPWFHYEWADDRLRCQKASTEDIVFTRDAGLLGVPNYVLWDCWAGHVKPHAVGRPVAADPKDYPAKFFTYARATIGGNKPGDPHPVDRPRTLPEPETCPPS